MSTQWVHERATGPVAWAAAVVTVTAVPMLAFLACPVDEPLLGPGPKALLGGALGWTLAGVLLAGLAGHRVARGIGVGLAAGGATTSVLVLYLMTGVTL